MLGWGRYVLSYEDFRVLKASTRKKLGELVMEDFQSEDQMHVSNN